MKYLSALIILIGFKSLMANNPQLNLNGLKGIVEVEESYQELPKQNQQVVKLNTEDLKPVKMEEEEPVIL